ncbi:MAG: peptidyl-prolyl cis-trans isomerase [Polyangia bacterium]|jgi:parvulin-like peptidyl-prolyl isomerase
MRPLHFWLPLALALTFGCQNQSPGDGTPVLARVGDTVITARDLEARIGPVGRSKYLVEHYSKPEKKRELLESLVQSEALYQEARRLGYDRDPAIKREMVNHMLQKEVDAQVNSQIINDGDVEQYYQAHANEFSRPDQVRFVQIVVKDRNKALKVAAETRALPKGNVEALRALVARDSEDEASRLRGGEVGTIDRNTSTLPKVVVDAAFALAQVHDVSDPVQTERGYTIIVLTQKQPGVSKSLAEAKQEILSRLTSEARQQKRAALTAEIRKRTKIEIDEAQLASFTLPLAGPGHPAAGPDKRGPGPAASPPPSPGH